MATSKKSPKNKKYPKLKTKKKNFPKIKTLTYPPEELTRRIILDISTDFSMAYLLIDNFERMLPAEEKNPLVKNFAKFVKETHPLLSDDIEPNKRISKLIKSINKLYNTLPVSELSTRQPIRAIYERLVFDSIPTFQPFFSSQKIVLSQGVWPPSPQEIEKLIEVAREIAKLAKNPETVAALEALVLDLQLALKYGRLDRFVEIMGQILRSARDPTKWSFAYQQKMQELINIIARWLQRSLDFQKASTGAAIRLARTVAAALARILIVAAKVVGAFLIGFAIGYLIGLIFDTYGGSYARDAAAGMALWMLTESEILMAKENVWSEKVQICEDLMDAGVQVDKEGQYQCTLAAHMLIHYAKAKLPLGEVPAKLINYEIKRAQKIIDYYNPYP